MKITFEDLTDKQKHAAYEHFSMIYPKDKLLDVLTIVGRSEKIEKDLKGWAKAHAQFFEQYESIDKEGKEKIGELLRLMQEDDKSIFEKMAKLITIFDSIGEL